MNNSSQPLKVRRVPGFSVLRFESLWMAEDHLVVCVGYGFLLPFIEDYRRFFFRDIQGIQVSTSQRHHFITVITGLLTFLSLGACFLTPFMGKAWIAWIVFFGLLTPALSVLLGYHLFKGQACTVFLKTAVQTTRLNSLRRVPEAKNFLARLEPLVREAQSALPPLTAGDFSRPAPLPVEKMPSTLNAAPPSPPPVLFKPVTLVWHWLSAALMLANSGLSLLDYFLTQLWPTLLGLPVAVGILLCPLVALIRQRQMDSSTRLAVVSWTGMAFSLFVMGIGYAGWVYLSLKHPEASQDQWQLLKLQALIKPGESSFHTIATTLDAICSLSLGLVYLWATFQEKRDRAGRSGAPKP